MGVYSGAGNMISSSQKSSVPLYTWISNEKNPDPGFKKSAGFAKKIKSHPLLARVLLARGIDTADEARSFLSPDENDILPPEAVPGLEEARDRLHAACISKEPVLVHGDYDVDGIAGAVILHTTLKNLGCPSRIFLPERSVDGYGLAEKAVDNALKAGIRLLVSVDCGISSHETIRRAIESGIQVIITDHHALPDILPENAILVHPDLFGDYPGGKISGATVAYKLACSLVKALGGDIGDFTRNYLPLAGIATIADVCPLTGENRAIVKTALDGISGSELPGLKVLVRGTGRPGSGGPVTARDIAFGIAPLLNAAGRMENPLPAAKLLLASSEKSAWIHFRNLEKINNLRKSRQDQVLRKLTRHAQNYTGDGVLVFADDECLPGLAGPVSSRLSEISGRPVCVLAPVDDAKGRIYRGSMRSSGTENLLEIMAPVEPYVEVIGGHNNAIGMTVKADFLEKFIEACKSIRFQKNPPSLVIDCFLDRAPVDVEIRELEKTGPWGAGNPQPTFGWGPLSIKGSRPVGRGGDHLQLEFRDSAGNLVKGIGFSMSRHMPDSGLIGLESAAAGHFILNSWQGNESVEFQFLDIAVNSRIK